MGELTTDEAARAVQARLEAGDNPTIADVLDFMEARLRGPVTFTIRDGSWHRAWLEVLGEERYLAMEIRKARTNAAAWDFLCRLVAEYRRRKETVPAALAEWAQDALAFGVCQRPRASRGSPPKTFRNEIICETIRELHDALGLPYEGQGRSAILAVAERLQLTYEAVDSIFYPRRRRRSRQD